MKMVKSSRRLISLVTLPLAIIFLQAPLARAEKSYQITHVHIDAQLHADGSMDVSESRTYQFRGSYRFAYRILPLQAGVQFTDFIISENGETYSLADTEEPRTYRITQESDQIEVRWFCRASNESRTFDFHYRVHNLVQRYDDAAVLYFKFIGDDWDRSSSNVSVRLRPPQPADKSRLNEWLHGPLWAASAIEEDGSVTAWCERLPKRTFLEIRALYPTDIFAEAPSKSGAIRVQVMREEAQWAEVANRRRQEAIQSQENKSKRWQLAKTIIPIISLLGFLAWYFFYQKYGKRPYVPSRSGVTSDIPAATPPALVAYLIGNRQVYANALVATLLDLARRGILTMREERHEAKTF